MVLERSAFSMDVEITDEPGASTRRIRWRLFAPHQSPLLSHDTYAMKREAVRDGEIALERARQRCRLHPRPTSFQRGGPS
jgi:hypothetical protein